MKFNYVRFKNFLSFGDELYTIQLSDPGITLLTGDNQKDGGSNGSGKSSAIVESVVYGLFGQTTKNLKADQIINNKNKCDCYVELSFNISQDEYVIRRYREHSEFGNKLVFEKNGVDVSKEKIRDTQDMIEATIHIGFKSFVSSIVLSQERIANFAETEPIERKRILENLLMFEFISKYHKGVKEILRKINPQLEILNMSLNEKRKTTNVLTNNLISYVDRFEEVEQAKRTKIEMLQEQLAGWKQIDVAKELSVRTQITEKTHEKESLVAKKEAAEEIVFQAKGNIKKKQTSINDRLREIDDINKNPEVCPVCKSKIKDGALKEYIQKLTDEVESWKTEAVELQRIISDGTEEVSKLLKRIEAKTLEISTLNSTISSLKDDEILNIQQKITQAESEKSILESQIGGDIEQDEHVKTTQSKLEEIKLEVKDIKTKIQNLEEEKKYYDWWKEALGNSPNSVKSFCVNHVLTSLNKYIKYYLEFFGYDITYTLNVELEDTIVKDGELITFSQLSGGEKRSVELSLVFALYEIVKLKLPDNINIIVLDELMSHFLDDVRISGALEILNELEERKLSVFVIDHKNLIKENLDCKIINIIKDKEGFSSLEVA